MTSPSDDDPGDADATEPVSVSSILRTLAEEGYDTQFVPHPKSTLHCGACDTASPAGRFRTEEERRLEGASDPDDMVLVVAAACPACGARGSVVLSYGPQSSPEDADVLAALPRHVAEA